MNCQPGDLAVIVSVHSGVMGGRLAENIGAFVDVIELDPESSSIDGSPCWKCRARQPMVGLAMLPSMIMGQPVYFTTPPGTLGVMADSCLRPIRPGKEPEKTTTPEDLGCFTI